MTPQDAVKRLCDKGLSEGQIARALEAQGVPCNQSTIHRIKTGETRDPQYSIGAALVELAKRKRAA